LGPVTRGVPRRAFRRGRCDDQHRRGGRVDSGAAAGWVGGARPEEAASPQNRKYRCAIGSTVAGSQVSSTPSARTS
jgi:hypothetical protein